MSEAQLGDMGAKCGFVIRCAVPDCDWGHPMRPLIEWTYDLDGARDAFRQHCIERHGLSQDDTEWWVWVDIVRWTINLVKK